MGFFPIIYLEHEVSTHKIALVKDSLHELYKRRKSNKNLNGDAKTDDFDITSNANNEKGRTIAMDNLNLMILLET